MLVRRSQAFAACTNGSFFRPCAGPAQALTSFAAHAAWRVDRIRSHGMSDLIYCLLTGEDSWLVNFHFSNCSTFGELGFAVSFQTNHQLPVVMRSTILANVTTLLGCLCGKDAQWFQSRWHQAQTLTLTCLLGGSMMAPPNLGIVASTLNHCIAY